MTSADQNFRPAKGDAPTSGENSGGADRPDLPSWTRMNVTLLQRANCWFGVPICFLLTLSRKMLPQKPTGPFVSPCNILFIKLAEQGSTVLAYPALRRAVELVGRERVYFITFESNRFIMDVMRVLPDSNVITVSVSSVKGFLWSMLSALLRLRRLQIDTAIDLEFFSRASAALAFLSGAERRVGFHSFFGGGPYRGNLLTHRLIYNPHLHTSETFLAIVEAALHDPNELPSLNEPLRQELHDFPVFKPTLEESAEMRAILGLNVTESASIVILNANSSDLLPLRRWPSERYEELARRLLAHSQDLRVVFTGSAAEAEAVRNLSQAIASPRCLSMAGKTTLRQLLVLYALADVLVTNDSGPAHFAALTPLRVVTLFGPETPVLFASPTPRNVVLWAGLPCSPCVNAYNSRQSPCRNNLCMQAIAVDQVFVAVCQALKDEGLGQETTKPHRTLTATR